MASPFTRFLTHTQRRITFSRIPLDKWSARRRDLYLTTHNTHNRKISTPPVGFEPTISAGERPKTHALDRTATGTGIWKCIQKQILQPGLMKCKEVQFLTSKKKATDPSEVSSSYQTTFRHIPECTVIINLTHWGRVTQICVFTLQLCKTDDANLRF